MKKILVLLLLLIGGWSWAQSPKMNGKWIQLFNGKDLTNWDIKIRGYGLNDNFGNTFRVVDGQLQTGYEAYDSYNERFGHIFYKQKFSAYLLVMEYRFIGEQAKNGPGWAIRNSGAMLHAQFAASMGKDQDFPISIEMQLLGGNGKDPRSTANLCTPGTNVVIDNELYTDHCLNSRSETFHGDQWVTAEVLVLGDSIITHFVNGQKSTRIPAAANGRRKRIWPRPCPEERRPTAQRGLHRFAEREPPRRFPQSGAVRFGEILAKPEKIGSHLEKNPTLIHAFCPCLSS